MKKPKLPATLLKVLENNPREQESFDLASFDIRKRPSLINILKDIDGMVNTIKALRHDFKSEKEYIEWLIYYLAETTCMQLRGVMERLTILNLIRKLSYNRSTTIRANTIAEKIYYELEVLHDKLSKFSGKKVKKARAMIYDEIKKKFDELNEEGANIGYVTAVNIIAKKYNKSSPKLYQAFKKWQNRQSVKSK